MWIKFYAIRGPMIYKKAYMHNLISNAHNYVIAFLLLIFCFLFSCMSAPLPPDGLQDIWTPSKLITQSVTAYGGPKAVLEFNDISYSMDLAIYQNNRWLTGTSRLLMKQPDMLYSEMNIEGIGEKIVFFDGDEAGELLNGKISGRNVDQDLNRRRKLTMIHAFFLENRSESVTIRPCEKVGDHRCAVLSKDEGEETWRIWIDLNSFLIRKIRLLLPKGQDGAAGIAGPVTVDWNFKEFKKIQGRQVPHTFITYLNDGPFQRGRISRFKMNSGLADIDFFPAPGNLPE